MKKLILLLIVFTCLVSSSIAVEISPHDLTFKEAAIIASRMPSPDGEQFLFGGISPKFKAGDKIVQEPDFEARYLRVHVIRRVEWDSYYKTWRYYFRAGGTSTEKNIHHATKSEIRDARRIKITMEELAK